MKLKANNVISPFSGAEKPVISIFIYCFKIVISALNVLFITFYIKKIKAYDVILIIFKILPKPIVSIYF